MRSWLIRFYILFSYYFFLLFYKKEYLRGRWFEGSETNGYHACWKFFVPQKILGFNRHIPFPCHPSCEIGLVKNLRFDVNNIDNFWKSGSYFQSWGGVISIGKGTYIAQNVGLITENHDIHYLDNHLPPHDISIGNDCWIGMNSVILPGVVLGENTIVGAGAVVTKPFPEGHVVLGGVPAQILKRI